MSQKPQQQFSLGGQALIEGVMMRSPNYVGAAVRLPDGTIETRIEHFQSITKRFRWLNLAMLRGVVGLFEMLGLGMKYLQWSGNIALEAEAAKQKAKKAGEAGEETPQAALASEPLATATEAAPLPTTEGEPHSAIVAVEKAPPSLPIWMFLLTIVGSLGIGMLLFVALPNLVVDWAVKPITKNLVALNLAEGVAKLIIFVAYIYFIGLRPDIRRVFEYHGAEHKVVYAAERDLPLTPESARPFDTPHPRCGTGFALLTVFVSVLVFGLLPWYDEHWKRVGIRLLLMPVVAGASYEVIKLTLHPKLSGLAKVIMIPGMWLQRLTTRQPDDAQLEVSCAAMRVVIDAEHKHKVVAQPGLV